MRTHLGMAMVVCPCPWMAQVSTMANAGASMFSAVPPIVWLALRCTEAKASSMENTAPDSAATSMARKTASCGCNSPQPFKSIARKNKQLKSAPMIIMPSRAMLMMPLRSENMPPRATSRSGTANRMVELRISAKMSINLPPS